jgi:hypothetical protein
MIAGTVFYWLQVAFWLAVCVVVAYTGWLVLFRWPGQK